MMAFFYATVSIFSTLGGGLLAIKLSEQIGRLRYFLAFAAGVMLSVAFFDMLPEIEGSETVFMLVGAGFFFLYLVEKIFAIHSCNEYECEVQFVAPVTLIGIGLETLLDGVALAIGASLGTALGLSIALAVIIHEFPRGFTTSTIMISGGYKRRAVWGALAIDSLPILLGVALVNLGLFPEALFPYLLAFALGAFIYVGASDLLPEAHRRINPKLVFSLLAGVFIVLLTNLIPIH